ncbi:MAG: hypothetical protein JKY37_21365 [Nannocystaceae bacterium]|nr:hypothetical protein [Nannocystaceae bacterium]
MLRRQSLFLASLLVLGACAIKDSSLGDLPGSSGDEGGTEITVSSSASVGATSASTDDGDLGLSCELSFTPQAALIEFDNPACSTGICVYPDNVGVPFEQPCDDDVDCGGPAGKVWCDPQTQMCEIHPAHIDKYSMCAETCEVNADCVGAPGSECESGFLCAPIVSLGSRCCEKTCICADALDVISAEELQERCEEGTAQGCCDQDPVPDACGG